MIKSNEIQQQLIDLVKYNYTDKFGVNKYNIQHVGFYICPTDKYNFKKIDISNHRFNTNEEALLDYVKYAVAYIEYDPSILSIKHTDLTINKPNTIIFSGLDLPDDELNNFYSSDVKKIINIKQLIYNLLTQDKSIDVNIKKIKIQITNITLKINYIITSKLIYSFNISLQNLFSHKNFKYYISELYIKNILPLIDVLKNISYVNNIIKYFNIKMHMVNITKLKNLNKLIKYIKYIHLIDIKPDNILIDSINGLIEFVKKNVAEDKNLFIKKYSKSIKIGNHIAYMQLILTKLFTNTDNFIHDSFNSRLQYFIGPFAVQQEELLKFWTLIDQTNNIIIEINRILITN